MTDPPERPAPGPGAGPDSGARAGAGLAATATATVAPPPAPPRPAPRHIWPRPAAATPTVLAAAALAGLSAAAALPWDRPGVGWLLVGAALGGLALLVASRGPAGGRRDRAPDGDTRGRGAPLWAGAALALLAMGALRASEWLFPWCVLGAALAGSVAVAGGRSVRGLLLGSIAVPSLAVGALAWAGRGTAALGSRRGSAPLRLAGAVLASVALLGVFAPLLAGADAEFARLLTELLPAVDVPTVFRWGVLFVLFGAGMTGASYLLCAPPRPDPPAADRPRRLRRVEWALPVGLLVVLFAVFVGVQLANLFGGGDHVLATTGLTYAEYARSGFWQLLLVTLLTLAVIMVVARYAVTGTAADRGWLRGLLGALALLTLVIVASALSRMWAYQQVYGFTVQRVLVLSFELWLGVVYLLMLGAGYRPRTAWLPRAVAGTGLAALLALGLLDPDRFIAERNIERWQQTGKIDISYLSGLSADAAPALAALPEPLRDCAMAGIARSLTDTPDDWRAWNRARSEARAIIEPHPHCAR
jgi:Domain of unknown function (DUF4173)